MSIDRCKKCGDLVDTDNEPEAYVEIARNDWICLCQECREEYEEESEQRMMPANINEMIEAEMAKDPRYNCKNCDWDVDGCSPCSEHEDL